MRKNMRMAIIALLALTGGSNAADFGDLGIAASGIKKAAAPNMAIPKVLYAPAAGDEFLPSAQGALGRFVTVPGGKFRMGTSDADCVFDNAKPVRLVAIGNFQMSRTAVTVAQYGECVAKGRCTRPDTGDQCNWGLPGREDHPVNCVDWDQANAYARFVGARLPTEAEWEYAATSGGRDRKYPWGNAAPAGSLVVRNKAGTMPVCSRPRGNTAQGLCDMAGNVFQWVQDAYRDSYSGAPVNGGAVKGVSGYQVIRGGSFRVVDADFLRAAARDYEIPGGRSGHIGFRIAR